MRLLLEWKNGNKDMILENVKEYNESVHDRKIYVSYNDDKENESYSMIQYMAVPLNWLFNGGVYMEVKDYLPKKIRDKVENIIVEADFDYDKNRSVQHYFVYLTSGERFDATTIKELKEKARQMN